MARTIAKRRAGVLGWVASPNGGINSLVLGSGCCPVRFDLDRSLFSGLESKAASHPRLPKVKGKRQRTGVSALHKLILRTLHQSTVYWIAVNIAQLLDAPLLVPRFYFRSLDPELEIVIVCLGRRAAAEYSRPSLRDRTSHPAAFEEILERGCWRQTADPSLRSG